MPDPNWHDLGPLDRFPLEVVTPVNVGRVALAVTRTAEGVGVISGVCNHVGGPLGEGALDQGYVVCPWHHWKFHHATGIGEPGFESDRVPAYPVRLVAGRVEVDLAGANRRHKAPHEPSPLTRPQVREPGPIRVVGLSTTVMDPAYPRFSTSEALLTTALDHCRTEFRAEAQLIRLHELRFRACEGYYSKSARACTWPCSITQMDPQDQLDRVYEAVVYWADVVLVATPIRWGGASSLYYKMIERMNCIQNQVTTHNRVLLHNKVAAFVITGGQDNVQAVAGQMLTFFGELGFHFPQFPFVAHTRGWSAEDMENNIAQVRESEELRDGAQALAARALSLAERLLATAPAPAHVARGGRKGCRPHPEPVA